MDFSCSLNGLELADDVPDERAAVQGDVRVIGQLIQDEDGGGRPDIQRLLLLEQPLLGAR